MSSPSIIIIIIISLLCLVFTRITHVKVCSVKSLPWVLTKMRKGNPVKFGCGVEEEQERGLNK